MIGTFPAASHTHYLPRQRPLLLLLLLMLVFSVPIPAQTRLFAWGQNSYGQLGDGSQTQRTSPVAMTGLLSPIALASGSGHSLALQSDGTVWAWGRNSSGQLGSGLFLANAPYGSVVPLPVPVAGPITSIACGQSHSLALGSNGLIWAWGLNDSGQIGTGISTDVPAPMPIPNFTNVIAIKAGMSHSVALKSDGTVWMWGYNGSGNLGDAATIINRPNPVMTAQGPLGGVVAIAAGGFHSLALKSDGTVMAWGRNASGQLGDNSCEWRGAAVPVKEVGGVGVLNRVIAIAAGSDHSLALKSDGTVWAWGRNTMGQLGDTTTNDSLTPVQVQEPGGFLTQAAAIAAGGFHSLALKSDGTVMTWGYSRYGQTGIGLFGDDLLGIPQVVTTPIAIPELSSGVALFTGDFQSYALSASVSLRGTISLQNCTVPDQEITVLLSPAGGLPSFSKQIQLRADGSFDLRDIPRRNYIARFKGDKWLGRRVTIEAQSGDVTGIRVLLYAGDANNDNIVDVHDLDLIIQSFDTMEGDTDFQTGADLDCDGSISVDDLDLMLRNFDRTGDT